ncbi:MAG: hypothetical protein PHI40_06540 [Caldisericia bacterium]|nr:hypothetical protein [Caldisericia bacterium]
MKKLLLLSISLCLLFTAFFVPVHADEKEQPTSYQYVFKVGSSNFHGVVDGVEGKGSLYNPIVLQKSGRAGIDAFFIAPTNISNSDSLLEYFEKTNESVIYFQYNDSVLKMIHPTQKYYIDDEEIPSEFDIIKTKYIQPASWNTIKKSYEPNYIVPLRLVFEFTGHKVDWNPDTQEITVTYPAEE